MMTVSLSQCKFISVLGGIMALGSYAILLGLGPSFAQKVIVPSLVGNLLGLGLLGVGTYFLTYYHKGPKRANHLLLPFALIVILGLSAELSFLCLNQPSLKYLVAGSCLLGATLFGTLAYSNATFSLSREKAIELYQQNHLSLQDLLAVFPDAVEDSENDILKFVN